MQSSDFFDFFDFFYISSLRWKGAVGCRKRVIRDDY